MAVAVSIYVSLGGFRAVVWTDIVQFIFLPWDTEVSPTRYFHLLLT
ncbi:MAG: hypothetical protein U9N48_08020 [Euryarchaeota archaeon]|nr:hypothetical protein [Euryarchaeota archaeon]